MAQEFERVKNIMEKNIKTRQDRLFATQKLLDEAIKTNETKKIEVYSKIVEKTVNQITSLKNQLKYIREDTPQDIQERLNVRCTFSKNIQQVIPNGVPIVFHGRGNISTIYEIIKSGGLKTPEDRNVDFRSTAEQIDVGNKYNIDVPVEFAEPGVATCRPYGAIFAFYPKEEEKKQALVPCGSQLSNGVSSIDFKNEDSRFVGVITTKENKHTIQQWLKEFNMDSNKVFTHAEFIEMCRKKFLQKNMSFQKSEELSNSQ